MLTSQTIGIKNGEVWISMRTGELFLTKGNLEAWKTKAIDIHSASVSESKCFLYTGFRCLELPDIGKPRLPFFKFLGESQACLLHSGARKGQPPGSAIARLSREREGSGGAIETAIIHHSTPNEKIKQLIILTA